MVVEHPNDGAAQPTRLLFGGMVNGAVFVFGTVGFCFYFGSCGVVFGNAKLAHGALAWQGSTPTSLDFTSGVSRDSVVLFCVLLSGL